MLLWGSQLSRHALWLGKQGLETTPTAALAAQEEEGERVCKMSVWWDLLTMAMHSALGRV